MVEDGREGGREEEEEEGEEGYKRIGFIRRWRTGQRHKSEKGHIRRRKVRRRKGTLQHGSLQLPS